MKKKLLVTASTFPRWEDDTEPRFVLDLCKYMTDEYNVTVLVPATEGAANIEYLEGVRVIRYHYFPVHKWETLCYPGAIVSRIKEKKIRIFLVPCLFIALWIKMLKINKDYDLIHAHWLLPQGIVQSFFRKPYIVTGHGTDVTSMNKGIMKRLKKRCLKKAFAVTVVSEYLKVIGMRLAPDIEPQVISMGVDAQKFGKQHRIENYFGQSEKKVILFVGRLVEGKGVCYLIESMKKVKGAMLYIVGEGPLRGELEILANKQTNSKIVFGGGKTHSELKKIYASADVFVAPSVTTSDGAKEGLGLVMLEAMASGLPVVASRSGGIVQVIKDGENGLLCEEHAVDEIAANINRILYDEGLRERLIEGAAKTVELYDYAVQAKKYKQLMEMGLS